MDLHLTAYFVAVIDHGGITKAAQALYISQPSLSQAIRTLEKRLGVTLFDRSGRRLELTDAGRRLEVAARRILADVDRAKDRVTRVRELRSGRVDIVTNSTLAIDPLVGIVRAFRTRYQHVVVRVISADGPTGILAALRHGEAELGLIDAGADPATFVTIPLGTQEVVLAADPTVLPDRSATVLPRAAIRSIPLVVDHSDQPTAAMIADLVADDGRNVVVDCAHPAATWELVSRGVGATILPRPIAAETLPHAVIVGLDPPLRRDYVLVTRSGQPSPAAAAFIAVARAHCGAPDVPALDGRDW
ncbi:LysR family transcriptional regulator [Gordonia sp. NPDC003376]